MELFFQWNDGNLVVTNWGLIGLLIVPGLVYGIRRGWQEEGFTAIGLGIAVTALGDGFAQFLVLLVNRVISIFPLGVAIILNRPAEEWPSLSDEVISWEDPWVKAVAFAVIALVAYRAGTILGRRQGVGLLGRIAGGLFGAMNIILILAKVLEISRPLEQDTVVDPPTVTILGMPSDMLKGVIVGLIGLIIGLFLLLAWLNRRRARE